jgi:4'-phosphopantetheinyl transferase
MDLRWHEQTEHDMPFGDEWLSAAEQSRLATLRIPKRRRDWRLGRWTAKSAVAAYLNIPRESLEVRAAPCGAPEVLLNGARAPLALSLSHSNGVGFCVVAPTGAELGCDLEKIEPRTPAFLSDYFTASEQKFVAQSPASDRDRLVTLLWSAKESTLKAMRCGLREDPCSLEVGLPALRHTDPGGWRRFSVKHARAGVLQGWWRHSNDFVRTITVLNWRFADGECSLASL